MTAKNYYFFLIITICTLLLSCKKENDSSPFYEKYYVKNFSCINQSNLNEVEICADSILDQRCPIDAVCTSNGYAVAYLNFKENNTTHKLKLGIDFIGSCFSPDTLINGFKITFEDLLPHRKMADGVRNPNSIATIIISK